MRLTLAAAAVYALTFALLLTQALRGVPLVASAVARVSKDRKERGRDSRTNLLDRERDGGAFVGSSSAAPRQRWVTATVLTGAVVPLMLAVLYVALSPSHWGGPGGFSSLADVALLFSNPWLLLAGWVHYLAFDLLVGTWEVEDARSQGVPHLLVVPCLF